MVEARLNQGQVASWGRLPITDALRAVAIISVVLFHTFPKVLPGGFIGVDIFFAISGFVITLNYLPDLISGKISYIDFFIRRVRRLLPALLAMIIVVSLASFALLLPVHLKPFAISAIAQGVYAQNFAFWVQGDYFDASYLKPLLHTWSLGVEEQFYFCIPVIVFLFKRSRRYGIIILIIISMASILAGIPVNKVTPKTVFYLAPFRVWEFSGGIAVALWYHWGGTKGRMSRCFGNIGVLVGVVAVGLSIVSFDQTASFPGPQALLAILGTMSVMAAQLSTSSIVNRVASNRFVNHIGLTSYSWYLWHWPLVVFFYVIWGCLPPLSWGVAIIVAGYGLGSFSFLNLEAGNQRKAWLAGSRKPMLAVGLMLVIVVGVAALAFSTNGAMFRYSTDKSVLLEAQMDRTDGRCSYIERLRDPGEICRIGGSRVRGGVLILGDSHAAKVKDGLRAIADERNVPLYLTKRNCQPTTIGMTEYCSVKWLKDVTQVARSHGISVILVVAHYDLGTSDRDYLTGFKHLVDTGLPIAFLGSPPEGRWLDPQTRIDGTRGVYPVDLAQVKAARAGQWHAMRTIAATHMHVSVIDPIPLFCPSSVCLRDEPMTARPLFSDSNHLSTAGVNRILPLLEPLLHD